MQEPIPMNSGCTKCHPATRALPGTARGMILIETALVLLVLIATTAGLIQLGRVFWHYNVVKAATRDAARYLSRVPATSIASSGNDPGAVAAKAFAKQMIINAAQEAGVTLNSANAVCVPTSCAPAAMTGVTASAGISIVDPWFAGIDADDISGYDYSTVGFTLQVTLRYIGN